MKNKLFVMFLVVLCLDVYGCSTANKTAVATTTPVAASNTNTAPVRANQSRPGVTVGKLTPDDIYIAAGETSNTSINFLESIPQLRDKEIIEADINRVPEHLSTNLPNLNGKTINVILQNHGDPNNRETIPEPDTIASQTRILETLDTLRPAVLAFEGASGDKFATRQDVIDDMVKTIPKEARTSPDFQAKMDKAYQYNMNRQAGKQYSLKHSECHARGSEILGVNVLTALLINADPTLKDGCILQVLRLRSWIALSRLSEGMKIHHSNTGTLIIGKAHQKDIQAASEIFGFKVVFYDDSGM